MNGAAESWDELVTAAMAADPGRDDFDDEDDEPRRDAPPDRESGGPVASRGFEDPVESYDGGGGDE